MKLYWYVCLIGSICCPLQVGATDQSMVFALWAVMMQSVAGSSESSEVVEKEKKQETKKYCAHQKVRASKYQNNIQRQSPKRRR